MTIIDWIVGLGLLVLAVRTGLRPAAGTPQRVIDFAVAQSSRLARRIIHLRTMSLVMFYLFASVYTLSRALPFSVATIGVIRTTLLWPLITALIVGLGTTIISLYWGERKARRTGQE